MNADQKRVFKSMKEALNANEVETVHKIIKESGLSYVPDWLNGYALLKHALRDNNTEVVKFLLAEGAAVNGENFLFDETPLHLAVRKNLVDITRLLLAHGARKDFVNVHDETPLHLSAACNDLETTKLLLNHGFSASYPVCNPPFVVALRNGHKEMLDLLLGRLDLYAVDSRGDSMFHFCARKKGLMDVDVGRVLLTHPCYSLINIINADGHTPFYEACYYGNKDLALLFLEYGCNVDSRCECHGTPLSVVCANAGGTVEWVEFLIENNADINFVDSKGKTPLDYGSSRLRWGTTIANRYDYPVTLSMLRYLLRHIALLHSANMYLNKENRRYLDGGPLSKLYHLEFDVMLRQRCDREIREMKEQDPTMYEFLTARPGKTVELSGNDSVIKSIRRDLRKKYRLYSDLILNKFKVARKRWDLLELCRKQFFAFQTMPHIVDQILDGIPNESLRVLFNALQPSHSRTHPESFFREVRLN